MVSNAEEDTNFGSHIALKYYCHVNQTLTLVVLIREDYKHPVWRGHLLSQLGKHQPKG